MPRRNSAAARVYPVWIFNAANQRHTAGVRVVDHAADIKPTIVQGNGQSVITKRRGPIDQIGRGVGDIVVGVGRRMRAVRSSASARAWLLSIHIMSAMPKMPEWLVPMAATLTQERFSGGDWLFERKFDGIRLLAYKQGSKVQLFSRNRLPQRLPAVASAVAKLPVDEVILDGEVAWDGESGYHVFDILWLNGKSVTALPLEERRALLKTLPFGPPCAGHAAAR